MHEPLDDKQAAVEQRNERKPLLWSLLVQLLAFLLVLAGWWLSRSVFSLSLLLGATAFTLPYSWFAWHTFLTLRMHAPPAKKMQRMYRGETQKFFLTAVLCALVFVKVHPLDAAGFFSAFIIMLVLGWALPAWCQHRLDSRIDRV